MGERTDSAKVPVRQCMSECGGMSSSLRPARVARTAGNWEAAARTCPSSIRMGWPSEWLVGSV